MQVRGIHHVNLNVSDLAESLEFYAKLGFHTLARPDFDFDGAWLQAGDDQIHLVVKPDALIDKGAHFAMAVDDLDTCVADLQAQGVKFARLPKMDGAGHQAFFNDPSGNLIELNQPLA